MKIESSEFQQKKIDCFGSARLDPSESSSFHSRVEKPSDGHFETDRQALIS
jgi:hypothetical protein